MKSLNRTFVTVFCLCLLSLVACDLQNPVGVDSKSPPPSPSTTANLTRLLFGTTIRSGSYKAGEPIDIFVMFPENVTVNTKGGTPRIVLRIGDVARYADYYFGSGSSILAFRYTVLNEDKDSKGIAMASGIALNGGEIKKSSGDPGNLYLAQPDNLENIIIDNTAPVISSASIKSDQYSARENIDLFVHFSEDVEVDMASGTPEVSLTVGNQVKKALYHSGSGSSTLVFRYEIGSTDNDSDGVNIGNSVNIAGGSIRDRAGHNAILNLTAPTNLSKVLVDNTAPSISLLNITSGNYRSNQNIDISVVFSENVVVDTTGGTPKIALSMDGKRKYAFYQSGRGTSTLIFRYIVEKGDRDADGIGIAPSIVPSGGIIQDAVGHDATLDFTIPGNLSSVLVDAATPKITRFGIPSGHYKNGSTIDMTVQFSENITVDVTGGTPRIPIKIGGSSQYATYYSGTGSSMLIFRYSVGSSDEDMDGIEIASSMIDLNGGSLKDSAANDATLTFSSPPNLAHIIVDNTVPSISKVAASEGSYKKNKEIDFTVTFSEPVNISTSSGSPRIPLTVGNNTRYAIYQSGSGSHQIVFRYTVGETDNDSDGIGVTSPIALNGGTILDNARNAASLTFTVPSNLADILVDTTAPTVSSVSVSNGTYRKNQNIDISVQFSEKVVVDSSNATPLISLAVGNATKYAEYHSGSGSSSLVFRYSVSANDNDEDGISSTSSIFFQ